MSYDGKNGKKDSRTWDNGDDADNWKSSRQIWNQGIAHSSHVPLYYSSRLLFFLSFDLVHSSSQMIFHNYLIKIVFYILSTGYCNY